jgi:hypothetical protein
LDSRPQTPLSYLHGWQIHLNHLLSLFIY